MSTKAVRNGKVPLYKFEVSPSFNDEKNILLDHNIILIQELFKSPHLLDKIGISTLSKKRILKEIKKLCDFID